MHEYLKVESKIGFRCRFLRESVLLPIILPIAEEYSTHVQLLLKNNFHGNITILNII